MKGYWLFYYFNESKSVEQKGNHFYAAKLLRFLV